MLSVATVYTPNSSSEYSAFLKALGGGMEGNPWVSFSLGTFTLAWAMISETAGPTTQNRINGRKWMDGY